MPAVDKKTRDSVAVFTSPGPGALSLSLSSRCYGPLFASPHTATSGLRHRCHDTAVSDTATTFHPRAPLLPPLRIRASLPFVFRNPSSRVSRYVLRNPANTVAASFHLSARYYKTARNLRISECRGEKRETKRERNLSDYCLSQLCELNDSFGYTFSFKVTYRRSFLDFPVNFIHILPHRSSRLSQNL